jgi:hypothetical protein
MQRHEHANPPDFGETRLDALQRHAFDYFVHETNPANGLVADKSQPGAPASIAAVGFALAAYPVGVWRGWMTRTDAIERTLAVLRFFRTSAQGTASDVTGYKGFYYHFLDMTSGRRAGLCELSTVDTSFLLAGMLAAAAFFDRDSEDEQEIRTLADALYRRADWPWACNGGATVTHGWKSESGFLPYRWEGYNEALLLYVLGLGSPTYPLPTESYAAWTATYEWKGTYGYECPMAVRSSSISIRTSGWTSVGSRMRSRETRASITSRTAAAQPTSSGSTRSETLSNSRDTEGTSGD